MIICVHQLIIEIVFDTFVSVTVKSMGLEGVQSILKGNRECSTRDRRPVSFCGRLSGIVDGIVDNGGARSDDFNI